MLICGISKNINWFLFFNPNEQKIFVSRNVIFLEEEFASKDTKSEITFEEESNPVTMTDDDNLTNNVPIEPIVRQEPRRSKRVIRPPVRLTLSKDIYQMESGALDDDPFTYQEAIVDKDVEHWKVAMEVEMSSMYSNEIWTLVERLGGIKPIGCKWVYKRNLGVTGKVETY